MNPVRVADGRPMQITEMTRPVRIALHTTFGPVALDHFALIVLLGTDDVPVLESPTLEVLDLDIYAGGKCKRWICWQWLLAKEAREIFTIATPKGLFMPTRVLLGVLNVMIYYMM